MPVELRPMWDERYREGQPDWNGPLPAALETLLQHRSVRNFSDRPLPDHLVELLIAAAQSAPTSSNKQFWSVVVVRDAERKRRLSTLCANQPKVAETPLLLVWLADLSRIESIGAREGRRLEGLDHLESFLVAALDAALAAQNALVAAESLGLGTCYIGAMRDHPLDVAAELALPARCVAMFGMCVGYPSETAPAASIKPRLPQQAVVHHEQYRTEGVADAVARHDGHYEQFRQEQGMSPANWSRHIMSRVATPEALQGREVLKETLQRMGFALR